MLLREGGDKWKEVSTIDEANSIVACLHCLKTFSGSATHIREHLPGKKGTVIAACKTVHSATLQKFKRIDDDNTAKANEKAKYSEINNANKANKTANPQLAVQNLAARKEHGDMDWLVAKAFCANGLPFLLMKDPHFKSMLTAVAYSGPQHALGILLTSELVRNFTGSYFRLLACSKFVSFNGEQCKHFFFQRYKCFTR